MSATTPVHGGDMEKAHSTHELEHEGVDKMGNEPRVVLTEEDVSHSTSRRVQY
jgi:hypothetical protein